MSSLKDKIFASNDVPSELVEIPEWDVSILVKGFTLAGKDEFLATVFDPETGVNNLRAFNVGVVVGTACDPETGEALFTTDDIPELKKRSATVVQRLVDVGARLSGLTSDPVESAGKDFSSTTKEEPNS
jgi:hypothetical protein